MDDRINGAARHQAVEQDIVGHIAFNQPRLGCHGPPKAGGEIVEHHDLFARVSKSKHHMAADVTRTAGDQNCHGYLLQLSLTRSQ